jgi:hypothetical protein
MACIWKLEGWGVWGLLATLVVFFGGKGPLLYRKKL